MDSSLLHPPIQKFITANIGADSSKLALQKNPFPDVNWIAILNQIAAKTKSKNNRQQKTPKTIPWVKHLPICF